MSRKKIRLPRKIRVKASTAVQRHKYGKVRQAKRHNVQAYKSGLQAVETEIAPLVANRIGVTAADDIRKFRSLAPESSADKHVGTLRTPENQLAVQRKTRRKTRTILVPGCGSIAVPAPPCSFGFHKAQSSTAKMLREHRASISASDFKMDGKDHDIYGLAYDPEQGQRCNMCIWSVPCFFLHKISVLFVLSYVSFRYHLFYHTLNTCFVFVNILF